MDMEKIRQRVLKAREYTDGLQDVFFDVKQNYDQQIKEMVKRRPNQKFSFSTLPKNDRHALMLLSPAGKFSARINKKVFEEFSTFFEKNKDKTDVFIQGRTGQVFFIQHFNRYEYQMVEDLEQTIKKLSLYQKIDVIYPRFYNVVTQKPTVTNLSGERSFLQELSETKSLTEKKMFLFEPNLDKILNFFELQIFAILVNKSIEESNLAHLGARLTTLELTTQTLEDYTQKLELQHRKLKRIDNNKKQRQRLAGIQIWN